ncbi:hypothetical protein ACDY95_24920 [Achromobacter ruhlandii]|uniref:hypothetical protein n=1 Tax=Achromobacter ruhlandii TaxID=72557 RepID=UPI0035586FB3
MSDHINVSYEHSPSQFGTRAEVRFEGVLTEDEVKTRFRSLRSKPRSSSNWPSNIVTVTGPTPALSPPIGDMDSCLALAPPVCCQVCERVPFNELGSRPTSPSGWMKAQGFACMEHNEAETELGREGIRSYAFMRVA